MDRRALIIEIKKLHRLLTEANKRAASQYILIDKLTAASVYVQALLRKLGTRSSRKTRSKKGRVTRR